MKLLTVPAVTNMKSLDDLTLINQAKQGKEEAFTEIFRRNKTMLRQFASRRLKNIMEADDFSQQVFIKVFKAIENYKPEYKFSTWIMTIAKNLATDIYRANKGKYNSIIENNAETLDAAPNEVFSLKLPEDDPSEKIIKEENYNLLKEIIETTLSARHKQLIQKFYYEQKSLEEIAQEMTMPLGTVKAAIHRAKKILREKLSRETFRD